MATIVSPLPGIFYRRPAPDEPPFVEPGQRVAAGEVLGIVEIMKQFTQLTATVDGVVGDFLIEDSAMLNPGDIVVTIEEQP